MVDNIDAHIIVFVQCDGKLNFRADAIDTGDEYRFFIPFEFKKTAKETDIAQNFRAESCFSKPGNSFFCLSRIGGINTR